MIKQLVTAAVQGYRWWFNRHCRERTPCLRPKCCLQINRFSADDRSFQNLHFHTYITHRGSDLPLHFISVCNRDLVTTGFGGMKPSRHTCRCQCPSRNRRIFQRYLETHPFGRQVSIITAADHSTKSVPFLLPFPISILAVLAPNWIARFFSLAAPCSPSSSASSLKSFFAGSTSCAAPSGEL
jgi:hypothetical protein